MIIWVVIFTLALSALLPILPSLSVLGLAGIGLSAAYSGLLIFHYGVSKPSFFDSSIVNTAIALRLIRSALAVLMSLAFVTGVQTPKLEARIHEGQARQNHELIVNVNSIRLLGTAKSRDGIDESLYRLDVSVFDCVSCLSDEIREGVKLRLTASVIAGNELPLPRPKEVWQIIARLKPTQSTLNPGVFDYERHLFEQGVRGIGYIKQFHQRMESIESLSFAEITRQAINQRLDRIHDLRVKSILKALSIGDGSSISEDDFELFRSLGVIHLIVISGLHIGIIAGVAYFIGRLVLVAVFSISGVRFSSIHIAGAVAVGVALLYAWIAGLGVASQRAVMMLSIWWLVSLIPRKFDPWFPWRLSLLCVLAINPLSIYDLGFWLSFSAVAILVYLNQNGNRMRLSGEKNAPENRRWLVNRFNRSKTLSGLFFLVKVQWVLSLVLGVVQVTFGTDASWVAPIVNVVAVPYVSLLVVPSLMGSLVFGAFFDPLASVGLSVSNQLVIWLLLFFDGVDSAVSSFGFSSMISFNGLMNVQHLTLWQSVSLLILGLLLFVPIRAIRFVCIGFVCFAVLVPPNRFESDDLEIHFIDVGQGLSILVTTPSQKNLLYDTGPSWRLGSNAGERIVAPYLLWRGIETLEYLVISHSDSDHIGGLTALLPWVSDRTLALAGEPEHYPREALSCSKDKAWREGDVHFTVLGGEVKGPPNNHSCVLLIDYLGKQILITGDIESDREYDLLAHPWLPERVDVMSVPHHGSNTSSSLIYLERVAPTRVINSSGFLNSYRHPTPKVKDKYRRMSADWYDTQDAGAITVRVSDEGVSVERYREQNRRYWRW